jgi:protein pelota
MKIIHQNLKKGELKVSVENSDDMWYLSTIVDLGDLVKGKTIRKIKLGINDQRSSNIIKKPVFLKIEVDKVSFGKTSSLLRISGKITEGPEDISLGSHHTFNVEENTVLTIIKDKWLKFQLDKVKEASSSKIPKILVCVFDREESHFALLKKYGYQLLSKFSGDVQKKGIDEKVKGNFYNEIIDQLIEYDKRHKLDTIILASPAFWKEDLMKQLKDESLKKKITLATCSSVGKNAIDEVLKRDETKDALKQDRIAKEMNLVEDLLVEISKNNLAAYGIKEVAEAVNAGAVKTLLVTDGLIHKLREQERYEKLDNIMRSSENVKADVKIISSEHHGGKQLDGLGGIGAILRYKLNY